MSLLLLLGACDDSFDPVAEDAGTAFAVFGYLDTAADTQFVRVNPLRRTLEPEAEAVRVRVSSVRLATGATAAWQDSLVRLDDGRPGLLFFAQIPVEPGEAYRLEVRGDGGDVTRAFTRVPAPVRLDPAPIAMDFNGRLSQRVALLGQTRPPRALRARYEVVPPGGTEPVAFSFPLFSPEFVTPQNLEVVVRLEANREEILRRLQVPETDSTVVLHSVGLEIEQLSDEWVAPETPANIENGFGFFGAIARYVVTWSLDPADVARLGYRAPAARQR